MTTPQAIEASWLAYARSVVADAEHIRECAKRGGSPDHPGVDATDLRWPGYLGPEYQPGGVLVVANVHRDFASGGFGAAPAQELVVATRAWRDGSVDDDTYLATVRRVYGGGLRKWTVGSRIGAAVRELATPVEAIAYTNAARCQYPELPPVLPRAGATKRGLVQFCVKQFPIDDLVHRIDARAVLFASAPAYDASAIAKLRPAAAVAFHQWHGNLTRPLEVRDQTFPIGTPLSAWAPALARHLGEA